MDFQPNFFVCLPHAPATSDASNVVEKQKAADELLAAVKEFDMYPFYMSVRDAMKWNGMHASVRACVRCVRARRVALVARAFALVENRRLLSSSLRHVSLCFAACVTAADVVSHTDLIACARGVFAVDESELTRMQTANATRLREFDAKIDDAIENLGESELRDAHLQKAGS